MRSFLFAPGDSPKKLARACRSGADAVILDLEDSVADAAKLQARATVAAFLAEATAATARPRLLVRINPLGSGFAEGDLAATVGARPDAILLPKAEGRADVEHLAVLLAVEEARAGLADGAVGILPIATETAAAVFRLGSYAGASARLEGLTWGAEDLSADVGAEANRGPDGAWTAPYQLARSLTLFGAAAAGVAAIDTVFTAYRDLEGLRAEAVAACRDGFSGKLAIHPDQVDVINAVFTPSAEAIRRAQAVVAALAAAPGVAGLDGEMVDRPHLLRAERVLARARAAGLV